MLYSKWRFVLVIFAASVAPAAGWSVAPSSAVACAASHRPRLLPPIAVESSAAAEDCGCETDTAEGVVVPTDSGVLMNDVRVTGASLRSTVLANVDGARVSVGDVIGEDGKAVIVFLRHLG